MDGRKNDDLRVVQSIIPLNLCTALLFTGGWLAVGTIALRAKMLKKIYRGSFEIFKSRRLTTAFENQNSFQNLRYFGARF